MTAKSVKPDDRNTQDNAAASALSKFTITFDDNRLVPLLVGAHDAHLARLEHLLGVRVVSRGNQVTVSGPSPSAETARAVLDALWRRLQAGNDVDHPDVDAAVRMAHMPVNGGADRLNDPQFAIATRRKRITPRTPMQMAYVEALRSHALVFGLGPAGTGKTYLAVAHGVSLLLAGRVERILLSRPAVEAGERLGFLPGEMKDKMDPYLRPLYDALQDMLPGDLLSRHMENGVIEIAPLAFMRGRTLSNAFVILDEAQNTTSMQMRMFLTRLGEDSYMAVTGDISQIDLAPGQRSGLLEAIGLLDGVDGISFVRFTPEDIVRHPLVTRIVRAYEAADVTARAEAERKAQSRVQSRGSA